MAETANQKKHQRGESEPNGQRDCTLNREGEKSSQVSGPVTSSSHSGKDAKPVPTFRAPDSSPVCEIEGKLGRGLTTDLEERRPNDALALTDINGDQTSRSLLVITRKPDFQARSSTEGIVSPTAATIKRPLFRTNAQTKDLATTQQSTQQFVLGKWRPRANMETNDLESDRSGSISEDNEYEIALRSSKSVSELRQNSVFVRNRYNPAGGPLEFVARFDTCADSNFISSRVAKNHGFNILQLPPADIVTYAMLEGECTPEQMVTLELQYPRSLRFYTDSFRVVKNNSFDILVGFHTIEKRGIVVQQHKHGIAFPSFKKKPSDEQAAHRKAIQERDHQTARELYQNMNSSTNSTRNSTGTNSTQSGSSSSTQSASGGDSNLGGNGNGQTSGS